MYSLASRCKTKEIKVNFYVDNPKSVVLNIKISVRINGEGWGLSHCLMIAAL